MVISILKELVCGAGSTYRLWSWKDGGSNLGSNWLSLRVNHLTTVSSNFFIL